MSFFLPSKREIIAHVISFMLGLASNASPTYTAIITSTGTILYLLAIAILQHVHPGTLLVETRSQITDMRIWLDDEASTRRSTRMYVITAQGRDSLDIADQRVKSLLQQHERNFTMRKAFRYALALPKLVIDARKCRSDVESLRCNLEDEVHLLSHS